MQAQLCLTLETRQATPWNFPGKNTEVDGHFFLQGIFLTQGYNLCPRPIPSHSGGGHFGHFPTPHKCSSAQGTLREGILAPVWDKTLGKSYQCLSPTHFRTKGLSPLYHYLQDCWVRSSVKDL